MSFIGDIAGKLGGGQKMLGMAQSLLDKAGGVDGLVKKFQGAGAGDKAQSWVSTGENKSVSADEVTRALGDDHVQQVADEAGVSKGEAANGLAGMLPELVDRLTPDGKVPDEGAQKERLSGLFG